MKLDKQHFSGLYASLANEQLAHIATTAQLTPVAKECLDAELAKRGIDDLSPFQSAREKAVNALEAQWKVKQNKSKHAVTFIGRVRNCACVMVILYGLYLMLFPSAFGSSTEGVAFIVVGIFGLVALWAYIRVKLFWKMRVINRPWWR